MIEIFDNIKKIYRFCQPHPELAAAIEWFSESCPDKTGYHIGTGEFSVSMFPSWTPTIWINLGTPYRLITKNQHQPIAAGQDILILRDDITTRLNQSGDHIFTVKFHPGGLESLLDISQSRLSGRVVSLTEILPAALIHQLRSANTFDTRVQGLQEFFLTGRRAAAAPKDHYIHLVRDCIATYETGKMQFNTSQLAEKMFCSSKTINRYFHDTIGLSPKKYFSILRARSALTAFVSDRSEFSPLDYGYYDMSHFYRESAAFTGRRMPHKNLIKK